MALNRAFREASRRLEFYTERRLGMLRWALIFFLLAIIASIFGFAGLSADFVGVARILFFVFIVLFIISLIFGARGRRHPPA